MVRALEVSVYLCAEKAVGERMLRVARDPRGSSAFNSDTRRARVGAIVRTAATHDLGIALSESNSAHGPDVRGNKMAIAVNRKGTALAGGEPRRASPLLIPSTLWTYIRDAGARAEQTSIGACSNESRAASSPAGRTLHAGRVSGGNTLLSLHLDNLPGLDTSDRDRRFRPRSWYRVRGPWQR